MRVLLSLAYILGASSCLLTCPPLLCIHGNRYPFGQLLAIEVGLGRPVSDHNHSTEGVCDLSIRDIFTGYDVGAHGQNSWVIVHCVSAP